MSKYTTELRYICENYAGLTESSGYGKIEDIIDKALPHIFDFDFPIYDEAYRTVLEKKIVRHFYLREIGAETVGVWKHFLCMKLNEIMPYYNQLYKSTLLEFNPLYDVDITTDHKTANTHDETSTSNDESHYTRTDDLTQTDSSTSETSSQDSHTNHTTEMYSDTPQGELTDVINGKYLTQARVTDSDYVTDDVSHSEGSGTSKNTGTQKNDGTSTGNGTRNFNTTEDYLEHVRGKTAGASFSKMVEEYRKTFINIDVMIINELKPLFMQLW